MSTPLPRQLTAEALGTALLVAAVVGSGIMGARLSGDGAVALLANTVATGAALVVLISIFGPISGAHFNPVVSMVMVLRREMRPRIGLLYGLCQIGGGIAGCLLANLMFDLPLITLSTTHRTGASQWLAEVIATFGLIGTILAALAFHPQRVPWLVGLYITSAYWFTASTSFANPAVTIARTLSDTFAGIAPADILGFIGAQVIGALLAMALFGWLLASTSGQEV